MHSGSFRMPPAFELIGLSKTFGTTVAADRVDLAVPQGSFYGFVGPNGAGGRTRRHPRS